MCASGNEARRGGHPEADGALRGDSLLMACKLSERSKSMTTPR